MGLFDKIELELPLPDNKNPADFRELQTKDISEPCMTLYRITKEGRLIEEKFSLEYVGDYSPSWAKKKNIKVPRYQRTNVRWVDTEYHGKFIFYGYDENEKKLYNYEAKFTDGNLVELKSI
jgi:hypothetical protein